jgi:CO/xanthine dehydrogenase FAD-binding subunit
MKRLWDEYIFADSVSNGLNVLDSSQGKARLMAGGTDLMLRLQNGDFQVESIVDITRIKDLKRMSHSGDKIHLGAALTHSEIQSDPFIREHLPLLSEASSHVGTPQVRNQGTIVGNIVNAQPAADTAVALLALDAEVRVDSKQGVRWQPIRDIYDYVGCSCIDSTREILTAVRCRSIRRGEGWAYIRIKGRNDLWLPTLNAAVWVSLSHGKILSSRIALGPVAPRLFRASEAEAILNGSDLSAAASAIERASREAMKEANPRDSALRGSGDYRKELVRVLVRRALREALERAGVNV